MPRACTTVGMTGYGQMTRGLYPEVPAGRRPLAGNTPSRSVSTKISPSPNQNVGSEMPNKENRVALWSTRLYGRSADRNAIGVARMIVAAIDVAVKISVAGG